MNEMPLWIRLGLSAVALLNMAGCNFPFVRSADSESSTKAAEMSKNQRLGRD